MTNEQYLELEDTLNLKYRNILDYLWADLIIEEWLSQKNIYRLWFEPWKVLDFTSLDQLENVLSYNQNENENEKLINR